MIGKHITDSYITETQWKSSEVIKKIRVRSTRDQNSMYNGRLRHTAGLDTIFVQIYMDPLPGVPGVSKDVPGSTKHAIWGMVR